MIIVKYLEGSSLLAKGVSETMDWSGFQWSGFLDMLLDTLGASLLRNMLRELIRVDQDFKCQIIL